VSAANFVDGARGAIDPELPARYRVAGRLGAGAQAETFAVTDGHDGARRVLKLFAAAGRTSALAEFQSLTSLEHPAIVRVRDIGRTRDGRPFIVTDEVVGSSLDRLAAIADDEARRAAFVRVAIDLATALALLHARGIVHGDVAPDNVRLTRAEVGAPRAVLIDFGLAGPALAGGGGARGTLGYAAPEALTGARTPATDLFGLGATLFEAWCGAPPFGRGLAAAQRVLGGPPPALSAVRPGLGDGWDRLIERLLAADPGERPSSARLVLREVARLGGEVGEADLQVPYPEGDPLAGLFVGRHAERRALRRALESVVERAPAPAVVALVGAPGAGRRTLFETVARDLAVAAAAGASPAVEIWAGDFAGFTRWLAADGPIAEDDPRRALEGRLARAARALEARAAAQPVVAYLDQAESAEAFARFLAGAAPAAPALVVVAASAALDAPFATSIELGPLGPGEVGALLAGALEHEPPDGAAEAIAVASGGNAAVASALSRRLVADLRAGGAATPSLKPGEDLDALLAQGFAALSSVARALVAAAALVDRDLAEIAGLGDAPAAAWSEAVRGGWLRVAADGAASLPSAAHRRVVLAAGGDPALAPVAERALRAGTLPAARAADALALAGRRSEAAEALRVSAGQTADADPGAAADLLGRALALAPLELSFGERVVQATGLGALGRYDEAAAALRAAGARAAAPAEIAELAEREAWLLARRGDLAGARATLERGLAAAPAARALRARLGRLLVTAGRHAEALATVDSLLEEGAPRDAAGVLAGEAALLAHAYRGELDAANRRLETLRGALGETRGAYLAGLLAQLRGDARAARDAYRWRPSR
jgi:hypothetical protein